MNWLTNRLPEVTLFFAGLIICLSIILAFDFNGLYGQDAYAYLRYSQSIDLIKFSIAAPIGAYWPVTFPLIGSLLQQFIASETLAMQMISVLSYAGSALVLFRWIKQKYESNHTFALLYTITFFLLSPYVLRFSILIMSDMLCAFFVLLTVYHTQFNDQTRTINLYLATVFTVLAITTRYVAVILVLAPLLHLCIEIVKRKQWIPLLVAIVLGLLLFFFLEMLKQTSLSEVTDHRAISTWSLHNFFAVDALDGQQKDFNKYLPNILKYSIWLVHPVYMFAGSIFLFITVLKFRKKIGRNEGLIWICILVYLLFISGTPFQNRRLLLIAFPLLLFLIYPGYHWLMNLLSPGKRYIAITICIFIQSGLAAIAVKKPISWARWEKELVLKIESFNALGLPVYNSGLDGPIKYYSPKTDFRSIFNSEIKNYEASFILIADSQRIMWDNSPQIIKDNVTFIFKNYTIAKHHHLTSNILIYEFQR